MENIFNKEFWIRQWENDTGSDTFNVHKGYSSPEYWDRAASTYNHDKEEIKNKRVEKIISRFRDQGLLYDGIRILEIGCGTGLLALELAKCGAEITALDFSEKMIERFRDAITPDVETRITLLMEDWHAIDIRKKGWEKQFDLVIAFMSPGVATPEAFFKMMACSKKGCAMQGWAAKKNHPIVEALWKQIQNSPLEDKPQSVLYKLNLLFSLGYYPEISFHTIKWHQKAPVDEECQRQIAFFKEVSTKTPEELEAVIRPYLESIARDGIISRQHQGLTAMAIWDITQKY